MEAPFSGAFRGVARAGPDRPFAGRPRALALGQIP